MNEFTQDLFWKNMPFKKNQDKIGFTDYIWNSTRIKNNTPGFLFTGLGPIDFYKKLSIKQLKKLKNIEELHIYLFEPIVYYNANHPMPELELSQHTLTEDLSYVKIPEFEDITNFKKNQNIQKIKVFTCDYNINFYFEDKYPELDLYCYDTFISSFLIDNSKNQKKEINRKFSCLNARFDTHRHLIMSYIVDKSGYYTWYYRTHYNIRNNYWSDNDTLPWEKLLKGSKLLNKTKMRQNEKVPIVKISDPFVYNSVDQNFKKTVRKTYQDNVVNSFCCIINETRYAQPTANFSEKTIHPITFKTPFIIVAPPYTLEYLKKLGFKTFDKWWDESYDTVEDHSQRMNKIFKVIDYIDSFSIEELNKMYQEMLPVLIHNAEHRNNLSKNFDQYVFKN